MGKASYSDDFKRDLTAPVSLQPIAMLLAEETTNKLGQPIKLDILRAVQDYDVSGRARALTTIVEVMAKAKEAGVDSNDFAKALTLVNWGGE